MILPEQVQDVRCSACDAPRTKPCVSRLSDAGIRRTMVRIGPGAYYHATRVTLAIRTLLGRN